MSRIRFGICLLCFFLSGVSALIYQTVWVRQLGLVFGASEIALVAVLAGFMGGLALGAAIASRMAGKATRPLASYAVIEVAVAVFALVFPFLLTGIGKIQEGLFSVESLSDLPPAWQTGTVAFMLSFLLLLIPTALMGMTLPLLVRYAIRSDREMGWKTAVVYAVNTAGAAGGALVSVFVLLPALGLGGSVWVAAGINFLVAIAAFLLHRRGEVLSGVSPEKVRVRRFHWVYPVILVSGMVSFSGEVMWTRLLSQLLGGTVYSFGTILAIFLVGLATGSAVASWFVRSEQIARPALGWALIGVAATLAIGFLSLDPWLQSLQDAAGNDAIPFEKRLLLAAIVLGPVACFAGATFPLAVRVAARSHEEMAAASARVFSWNTAGAIAGAILSGVSLLPALRYTGTLLVMIAACLVLAIVVSCAGRPLRKVSLVSGIVVLGGLALLPLKPPAGALQFSVLSGRIDGRPVAFYRVGRTSNVLLYDEPAAGDWRLITNGLPEATIQSKGNPPQWFPLARSLPLYGMLGTPDAKSLMVVGLGGGLALENVPVGIEKVEVVELEPEVVAANRSVAERRRKDPLADPRVRIHIEDARSALRLSREKFDIVVSQPSHPFTSGSSHLYTREFFELVHSRLQPGGTFVQWMGSHFVDEDLLLSLLASLTSVFENVEVYLPGNGGSIVFLARDTPGSTLANVTGVVNRDSEEFAATGIFLPEELMGAFMGGGNAVRNLSKGAPLVTDRRNLLQTRGPWVLDSPFEPEDIVRLFAAEDPFEVEGGEGNANRLVLEWLIDERYVQAESHAARLEDPHLRNNTLGQIALAKKQYEEAREWFQKGLESAVPEVREEAASGLFFSYQRAHLRFDPEILRDAGAPLSYAVTQAVEYAKREDWEAMEELSGTLEKVGILHPLYDYVLTIRMTYAYHVERWAEVITISELPGRWPDSLSQADMIAMAYAGMEEWELCLTKLSQLPKTIRRTENTVGAESLAVRKAMGLLERFPKEYKESSRYRALQSDFETLLGL